MSDGRSADAGLSTVGSVLEAVDGRISLRSFDGAFLSRFFPVGSATAHFRVDGLFSYAKTEGASELRELIAQSAGASPEDVVVTDGASQALFLVLLAGLSAKARLLVPRPVFPAYLRIAGYRGCSFEYYEWRADGADLLAKLDPAKGPPPDSVIINSPHNPTGIVLDGSVYDRVLERVAATDCLVILDDAYAWLEPPVGRTTRLCELNPGRRQGGSPVAIGSLGKLLCIPGMRLGFIVTEDRRLRDKLIEVKRHLVQASCPASEELAAELLTSSLWAAGRQRLLHKIEARRVEFNRIATELRAHPICDAHGFYAYASDVHGLDLAGVDGIPGPVFEGGKYEARYCLAAADSDWSDFLALSTS